MSNLIPLEHQNQRILTTKQLAEIYECNEQNIKDNFNRHKEKFIKGKHYYLLKGEELRDFKNYVADSYLVDKRTPSIYLWTERGASRHCKILDTDKAWDRFDELEESYFNNKSKVPQLSERDKIAIALMNGGIDAIEGAKRLVEIETQPLLNKIEEDKPLVSFAETISQSSDSIDIGVFAKLIKDEGIKLGRNKLFDWLRNNKYLMKNNQPYQKYIDNKYFEIIEYAAKTPYGEKICTKTLIKGLGQIKLIEKLRKEISNT